MVSITSENNKRSQSNLLSHRYVGPTRTISITILIVSGVLIASYTKILYYGMSQYLLQ